MAVRRHRAPPRSVGPRSIDQLTMTERPRQPARRRSMTERQPARSMTERPRQPARRRIVRQSGFTSIAAGAAVLSGLALDVAIASRFGAGGASDAFFVAARLPLGLVAIIMVGANQALVPLFSVW